MSTSSETLLNGNCQCGSVRYSSTSLPSSLSECYCTTCRHLSGAPFMKFGDYPISSISFTQKSSLKTLSLSKMAERTFCGDCGTPISMAYKCEPGTIGLTMSTVDEESVKGEIPPVGQRIFTENMPKWEKLPDDGVKSYKDFSDSFQKVVDSWNAGLKGPGLG